MQYDIFISHASEDTDEVARPLAVLLRKFGLKVWLDEFELIIGDSIRRKIDWGLANSRFGVVILSKSFFQKKWTNRELDGLVARDDGRMKGVLAVWHGLAHDDVAGYSPVLAGKLGVSTDGGVEQVAKQILRAIQREPDSDGDVSVERQPEESASKKEAELVENQLGLRPQITSTTHLLPFDVLSPLDFERLCLWLVRREGFARAEHLGAAGGEQGRDILAWRGDKLVVFQCKRVQRLNPAAAEKEIERYASSAR